MKKVGHTSEFSFVIHWWTLKNLKNQTFEKMKNIAGDTILHMCSKKHSYEVQFLRYGVRQNFLSFWAIFCPVTPLSPNNPENQNFEKMKKTSGDVIILNLCNKKHNHMIYAYSNMECHRHNCHFRSFFPFLPHYWPWKLKFGKNVKKPGYIILLHMCTINQDHMMYGSWDMKCNWHNFFVILDHFLPFYPPNSPKNENIKNEKKAWKYHFTQLYQKSWHAILFLRYGVCRM